MNQATLLGRLGHDSELKETKTSGQKVLTFYMATSQKWKDKEGKMQESIQWHRIVVWGNYGESLAFLKKGQEVLVVGTLKYNAWKNAQGQDVLTAEVHADRITALRSPAVKPEVAPEPVAI